MAIIEKAHRRDQMLEVAAKLFSGNGYNGTSMKDLADGLGILRGSLYAHIDSKQDLLFDIVDRGADRFLTRMKAVADSTSSSDEKVRLAVLAHVSTVAEHMDAATVFLNEWRFLTGDRRRKIESKRRNYEKLIRRIVESGIKAGSFRPNLDTKFAALLILSTVNWMYQWFDPKGQLGPEQIASTFSEMILEGLETKGKK